MKPKAKHIATNHNTGRQRWHKTSYNRKPGPHRRLELVDEFLMVMMRLRLDLLETDLAQRFGVSDTQVSRILSHWLPCLA